jgi:hypothetical protein
MHVEVVVVVEGVVPVVLVDFVVHDVTVVGEAVAVGGVMHVVNPEVELRCRVIVVDVEGVVLGDCSRHHPGSNSSSEASCAPFPVQISFSSALLVLFRMRRDSAIPMRVKSG